MFVYFAILKTLNFPSQKLFYFFIPVIAVLGVFVLVKDKVLPKSSPVPEQTVEIVSVKNSVINETDTDGDGLKDWEEALWGTDPLKPISNPQKIADAEFVKIKIEKEGVNASTKESFTLQAFATEDENVSTALGKDMFAEYVSLKKSGQATPDKLDQLALRLAENTALPVTKKYTTSQVKTFPDANKDFGRIYANNVAGLKLKYQNMVQQRSTRGPEEVTDANVSQYSEMFSYLSTLYTNFAKELMTLSVPKGLVNSHIDLANSLAQSANAIKNMSLIDTDPTRALIGVESHSEAEALQESALITMSRFFTTNGIIFTTDEPAFSIIGNR